jgi:DNA-binding winged helix-turn-helix (wHTH) protein
MQLRWADCRVDLAARTLERGGKAVRAQPLTFDLLALLLRHRGRVVSDAHLRAQLWPDVVVGDAALRQALKEVRRAIGDDDRSQRQIETVRGLGLRFVAPVEIAGAAEASFVGREELIAILEGLLDAAGASVGGVALLSGSAGIGKTALLAEIAARAEARGWRVLTGWARAGAESDAYALWTEVAEALGVALTAHSPELPASGGISESQRYARFRELQRALLAAARAQPLLVALDDLQFADRESLALLRFVAPALRAARVFLVGTHRTLAPGDEHTRELAALAAEAMTRALTLRGLDASELRALVRTRLGAPLGDGAADALASRTGGSPLLALEAVRAFAPTSAQAATLSAAQIEASVLPGVVPLVRRRLAALGAGTRRVLHAASVAGAPFDIELVRASAGCAVGEAEDALRDAERGGLVERGETGAWRFAHPLFAEAVADDLASSGEGATAALHRLALAALESRPERDAFRLASHAFGARSALSPAATVAHLRRAARGAWRMHAVEDAEAWQQRAVEIAESSDLPPLELCDLLLELGDLTVASRGTPSARVPFDRAARIARDLGDAKRLSRAALGYAHRALSLHAADVTLAWLRAAYAAPSGDPSLEARVATRLGAALLESAPLEREDGARLLAEGVARARRGGDTLTLARVLADQSICFFSASGPETALALAREVASCGRHAGDIEIEFRGLAEVTTVQLERGDRAGFDEAFADCEELVRRAPIPYAQGMTHGVAALRALIAGQIDEASAAMDAADTHARATGSLGSGVVAGLQRFQLARERGGLAPLLPALDQARAHLPNLPGLAAIAGLAHGLCGKRARAREAAEALALSLDALPQDRTRLATLAVGAELAYLARSTALASALEPHLTPFAALHGVAGIAATYWGSLAHALGFVGLALGRRSVAIRQFERALRAHEALGAPAWSRRSAEMLGVVRGTARGSVRLVS